MEVEALQERALQHVAALSAGGPVDPTLRVTLNFHPDRITGGRPILAALVGDGFYRSQFVTGTSNGGLTAHQGGDRWHWESRIFGGVYDAAPADQRPVYGALDFRRRGFGGSPRFGSAHFRLTAGTLSRSTFCYPDSAAEPADFGTSERMALIDLARADERDPLDDYVEAHVHGPVDLGRDVEALVLDPCFQGGDVEAAARLLPCPIEWHAGWRLDVEVLQSHPEFRGPEFVELGTRIAVDGVLDARVIGDASRSGLYDQQSLKRVWHYVARFGSPSRPSMDRPSRRSVP